jgi:tRNA (pseudouridine54-N1)-methyltransferase
LRRFVVIGRTASASPDFSLVDLAGTSGRLDVLARCVRAALLVSHGVRKDTLIYLVLGGGPRAPRVVRIDGAESLWIRPEERRLATIVQRALEQREATHPTNARGQRGPFLVLRNGVSVADGGLDVVLAELPPESPRYVLDVAGRDVRAASLDAHEATFFLGDHLGLDEAARAALAGCEVLSLGPVGVLAEDAITLLHNDLDRAGSLPRPQPPENTGLLRTE